MTAGPEITLVEQPFIDQLIRMGWKHTTGNLDHPTATGREGFRDVLIEDDLRKALRRINLDPNGELRLAHLVDPNHTPEFLQRVTRAMPDYEQRKLWLAEHGGRLVVL